MSNLNELTQYVSQRALTYAVVTYGCQMNEHESEKLRGILESVGYTLAESMETADFIIFNTCCVRENAEHKTFGNVGALKGMKEQNPELLIAVCGCMTQQKKVAEKMYRTFPFVDIVIGTHNMHELAGMIKDRVIENRRVLAVADTEGNIEEGTAVKREAGPLASVNIMYGCNNFCSYCIVPYVRGAERSREADNIVSEIAGLAVQGYREVMLLGQNVNSYAGLPGGFSELLERICSETDIDRVRFMTSHPKDIPDSLIEVISRQKKLCKHIHLPVQSGSSTVLAAMNRGYTREGYMQTIAKLRAALPEVVLTTDIIVGFPGETDQDFKDTMSLVEQIRFDAAFTFVYSKRSGTAAAEMPNQIDKDVKTARIVELIALQNAITEQKNRDWVGKRQTVLAEGYSTRDARHICGRTDGGKMVNFEGDDSLIGSFCEVDIVQAKRTTLFGRIV